MSCTESWHKEALQKIDEPGRIYFLHEKDLKLMYQRILHATDLSENHFHMSQRAAEVALRFSAQLYLLHVIETPPSIQLAQGLGFATIDNPAPVKEDAKAVLAVLGEALSVPIEQQLVKIGSIHQEIKTTLKELGLDLLIIGRQLHHHLFQHLENNASFSSEGCDILTLY